MLIILGEFSTYLHYCKALRYEDRPDYNYLKKLFNDVMVRENYSYDYLFDWTLTSASFSGPSDMTPNSFKPKKGGSQKDSARQAPEASKLSNPTHSPFVPPTLTFSSAPKQTASPTKTEEKKESAPKDEKAGDASGSEAKEKEGKSEAPPAVKYELKESKQENGGKTLKDLLDKTKSYVKKKRKTHKKKKDKDDDRKHSGDSDGKEGANGKKCVIF